jgi:GH15 family glucan-1,4-alpha-glucosidase
MNKNFYVTALLLVSFSVLIFPQTISFESSWRFKPGDDSTFAKPELNDSGWDLIKVPSAFETQGYPNLDGYVWYRVHFKVSKNKLKLQYYVLPGKIDDVDATYLNGILIGSTGKFPPDAASEWNTQRAYKVPDGLLKEENVLAIRVFDMGGPGGIQSGLIGLYSEKEYKTLFAVSDKPAKSFFNMVTSNGLIAAVYDEKTNSVASVFPHIFQSIDNEKPVKAFISDIKIVTDDKPRKVSYENNTHVMHASYKKYDACYYASFVENSKIFGVELSGEKKTVSNTYLSYRKEACDKLLVDSVITDTKAGYRKVYLFSFDDALQNNDSALAVAKYHASNFGGLAAKEVTFMRGIFIKCKYPKGLSAKEKNVFEQSIAFLKMAQVGQNEVYPKAKGQILASLPPGIWNICWIRDASYSVRALTRLGLYEEAKNALLFFLNAESNHYKTFKHSDGKEYGIGYDYQISVCRYFGMGKEESDFNADGPNIELDGFGLFLSAFCDYVERTGDKAFFEDNYKTLKNRIAFALVSNIAGNGLVRKESGSWERHLPGRQYAYTSITAAKGLKDFAATAKKYGHAEYEKYSLASTQLLSDIQRNLVINNSFIKGCVESATSKDHEYYDAATFEYFNFFPEGNGRLFSLHYDEYLRNVGAGKGRGFFRVNNGDWYDKQEWIFLDLRAALGLKKFSHFKESNALVKWVTDQAALNNNMIPELFNEKTAGYEGAVPMVGFGAGSYILTKLGE